MGDAIGAGVEELDDDTFKGRVHEIASLSLYFHQTKSTLKKITYILINTIPKK